MSHCRPEVECSGQEAVSAGHSSDSQPMIRALSLISIWYVMFGSCRPFRRCLKWLSDYISFSTRSKASSYTDSETGCSLL